MGAFQGISARTVAGFACQQGFLYSLFYSGSNRALEAGGFSFERVDLLLTFVFLVAAFILVGAASSRARNALLAPTLVGWYAVLLVIGSLLVVLPIDAGLAEIAAEGALVGLPSGFLLCGWGRTLISVPIHCGAREILLATAIGAAASLAVAAVPVPGASQILCFTPIGSAVALRSLADNAPRNAVGKPQPAQTAEGAADGFGAPLSIQSLLAAPAERAAASRLTPNVVAGTALFGLSGGLMEVFSSEPGMPANPAFPATLLILALFCVAALQFYTGSTQRVQAGGAEGSLTGVYRIAILLIMAGCLFVTVLDGFGITGQSITLGGYLGLTCVLMTLLLTIGRASGRDGASTFARGLASLFAGEIAGIAAGNALELAQPYAAQPVAFVAFAGLASLFAYLFLFTENDYGELAAIADGIDLFDEACRRIAEEHALSKRETEVLPMALRGRTSERIAEELCIAKSTADTHLRRIYAKTGVHSRQELIDLSERMQAELSGNSASRSAR